MLPGVGAFGDCMDNLKRYGLDVPIRQSIASGKPFLGICLGLQLLFTESEEFGRHEGLGIIPGTVKHFPASSTSMAGKKIPHMGWNTIAIQQASPLLQDIPADSHVYFVHSYFVEPKDPNVACSMTEYGVPFVSSIWKDNIFATQFHPEKSQKIGLQLFRNFGNWQ